MLPSFARQTVTVLTATKINDHGTQVDDWTTPTQVVESGWSVQPNQGSEVTDHRDSVLASYIGYGPVDSSVTASARVRVDGTDFEVVAEPRVWRVGVGRVDHVEVLLNVWREAT